jgi:hypothetical protein
MRFACGVRWLNFLDSDPVDFHDEALLGSAERGILYHFNILKIVISPFYANIVA